MGKPLKVLVTGGAGFIGTYLVNKLLDSHYEVTIFDDFSTSNMRLTPNKRANLLRGNVLDTAAVEHLVNEHDMVFHLASAVGVKKILNDPLESIHSTLLGGLNVLNACHKYGKRILITSTSEIYGKSGPEPLDENSNRILGQPQHLRWSYSESKALLESLASSLGTTPPKLDFLIARLFNVTGPGQSSKYGMVLPAFVRSAISNSPIYVYGDGLQTRTFCDVRDVCDALVRLMEARTLNSNVFNVGGNRTISMIDLAHLVKRLSNSNSQIELIEYSEVYGDGFEDMRYRVPNTRRIEEEIGWTPLLSLEEIIRDVIDFEVAASKNEVR